jgi:3-oxoacyl-[acyl-carrier-protein] synthase-1
VTQQHRHFGGRYGAELAVGAVTAVNALGFSAYETWACRRAELTGYGESPFRLPDGERATMAFVPTLAPTSFGGVRLLVLLERTLTPLIEQVAASFGQGARVGLSLCLPERLNGRHAEKRFNAERRQLESHAHARMLEHGLVPSLNVQACGHAAGAFGLLWAGLQLESEQLDAAIVGGVDSYYDPEVMQALMLERRVFCPGQLDAIIPGEAASFALIATRRVLRAKRVEALCRLDTLSIGSEPCHMGLRTPCMGLGLSRTALAASDRLREEHRSLDCILGDVTNEDYRTHEFQLAFPRFARDVVRAEIPLEFLPMATGDLGAATLPTALAIVSQGFTRGDPAADTCLMLASSIGQERGAVLASRVDAGSQEGPRRGQ